jgi:hypothetical protein
MHENISSAQSKPGEILGRRATGLKAGKFNLTLPMFAEPPDEICFGGFLILKELIICVQPSLSIETATFQE